VTRAATAADAAVVAGLLHAFADEFGDPTPGEGMLAARLRPALARDEVVALLAGDPPAGVALLTFRPSVWTGSPVALLEDLYVEPAERGRGLGRALLRHSLDLARERGATTFELYTGEGDTAARRRDEAHGLLNVEPGESEPLLYYYRRL
jgi:GNAT superfamily N-acetyltransferase